MLFGECNRVRRIVIDKTGPQKWLFRTPDTICFGRGDSGVAEFGHFLYTMKEPEARVNE